MTSKKFLWKASLHLLVFLIPTQLAFHFWPDFAFVFGLRIDYLAPTIYLTDILAFLIIVPNLKPILNWLISNKKAVLIIILYSGLNIYFSDIWMISLLKWLKLLELYLLGLSVYLNRDFVSTQSLYKTIYISAVLFGLISIVQIILNRTTGFLWVFGERSFSAATPGIALASFFGTSLLRGYSTFPHPNAFAGFIGVTLLMLVNQISKNKLYFVLTAFLLIPFVLTFSLMNKLSHSLLLFILL